MMTTGGRERERESEKGSADAASDPVNEMRIAQKRDRETGLKERQVD